MKPSRATFVRITHLFGLGTSAWAMAAAGQIRPSKESRGTYLVSVELLQSPLYRSVLDITTEWLENISSNLLMVRKKGFRSPKK